MTSGWRSARSYSFLHFICGCGGAKCALRHDQRLEISPKLWRPPLVVDQAEQVLNAAARVASYLTNSAATPCNFSVVMDQVEQVLSTAAGVIRIE